MIRLIEQRLLTRPFKPFYVVTTGGNRYPVPTSEHAGLSPRGTQVVIWFDDGGNVVVPGLHICAVEEQAPHPLSDQAA